jgi:hypothetical protein
VEAWIVEAWIVEAWIVEAWIVEAGEDADTDGSPLSV